MSGRRNRFLCFILLTAFVIQLFAPPNIAAQDRQLEREKSDNNQKRLALVIGNGAYQKVSPLSNPVNDANDMAAVLQGVGFEVVKGTDANLVQMRRLIREFGEKLEAQKGIGLFYFAGHGVEVRGKNFLIPVDADISREVETEDYAIDVNTILRQMDAANNGFNIVILDACRNNPFSRGWNRSNDTGGLANVNAPTGTYIAYAAAPGTTASDGKGKRNGIFTGALLKNLKRPNLKLEEVFKATREEVMTQTANKQVPWDSSSIKGDFYFVPKDSPIVEAVKNNQTTETVITAKTRIEQEREAWDLVKNSTDAEDFRFFLKEFPDGANAGNAKIRLEETVWLSVKNSTDKAKVQAYLNEFPNGANASAARIKLRQLEATSTTTTQANSENTMIFDVAEDFSNSTNPYKSWGYGYMSNAGVPSPSSFQYFKQQGTFYDNFSGKTHYGIYQWRYPLPPNTPIGSDMGLWILKNTTNNYVFILSPKQVAMLPSTSGHFCAVRWTAPDKGNIKLTAGFGGVQDGTTTKVYIFFNTELIFTDRVNGKMNLPTFDLQKKNRKG